MAVSVLPVRHHALGVLGIILGSLEGVLELVYESASHGEVRVWDVCVEYGSKEKESSSLSVAALSRGEECPFSSMCSQPPSVDQLERGPLLRDVRGAAARRTGQSRQCEKAEAVYSSILAARLAGQLLKAALPVPGVVCRQSLELELRGKDSRAAYGIRPVEVELQWCPQKPVYTSVQPNARPLCTVASRWTPVKQLPSLSRQCNTQPSVGRVGGVSEKLGSSGGEAGRVGGWLARGESEETRGRCSLASGKVTHLSYHQLHIHSTLHHGLPICCIHHRQDGAPNRWKAPVQLGRPEDGATRCPTGAGRFPRRHQRECGRAQHLDTVH
jgi:hypothetical protein